MDYHPRRVLDSRSSEGMSSNVTALLYDWLVGHRNTVKGGRKSACLQWIRVVESVKSQRVPSVWSQELNYHYN